MMIPRAKKKSIDERGTLPLSSIGSISQRGLDRVPIKRIVSSIYLTPDQRGFIAVVHSSRCGQYGYCGGLTREVEGLLCTGFTMLRCLSPQP